MQKTLFYLRKKWILALIAAAVVGSGAYAFAATLSVSSSSLGAGNAAVASCASAAKATYTTAFDNTASNGHYRVNTVKLTWDAGATPCVTGDKLSVTLEDVSHAALRTIDFTLGSGGELATGAPTPTPGVVTLTYASGSDTVPAGRTFNTVVAAQDVTGVAVAAAGV